jgi:cytidylate kinase
MSSASASPKRGPVIAIDGPAGTGKSSVTRRLAERLGFVHVDTGSLYRAVGLLTLQRLEQEPSGHEETFATELARTVHLEFRRIEGLEPANRLFANGNDVTALIRSPEVSMAASRVSAIPGVRSALLGLQRRLGAAGRTILEGRDIGTVIFPDADLKIFLTASVDERARRRLRELEAASSSAGLPSFEEVRRQIEERDHGDSTRAVAPLRSAPDAIPVDTSALGLDEVVSLIESKAREKLGLPPSM